MNPQERQQRRPSREHGQNQCTPAWDRSLEQQDRAFKYFEHKTAGSIESNWSKSKTADIDLVFNCLDFSQPESETKKSLQKACHTSDDYKMDQPSLTSWAHLLTPTSLCPTANVWHVNISQHRYSMLLMLSTLLSCSAHIKTRDADYIGFYMAWQQENKLQNPH